MSAFFVGSGANADPKDPNADAYMSDDLRDRATCVLIREGKLLLVADSESVFMLPGGGVDPGETIKAAAERELLEETGLNATRIDYLYSFDSAVNRHNVFIIEADGMLDAHKIESDGEIHGFLWWDMEADLPVYPHVTSVRRRLRAADPAGRPLN